MAGLIAIKADLFLALVPNEAPMTSDAQTGRDVRMDLHQHIPDACVNVRVLFLFDKLDLTKGAQNFTNLLLTNAI